MNSYELPLAIEGSPPAWRAEGGGSTSLPEALLAQNAVWFCRLRWVVVTVFVLFGAAGLFLPRLLAELGLRRPSGWPFVIAAVLVVGNLAFLAHTRVLGRQGAVGQATANLSIQICFDLAVLTAVVHHVGSLETYAPFAYLFHIALACIFFPRGQSLIVTVMACFLYTACVVLEESRVIAPSSIYSELALRRHMTRKPVVAILNVASAVVVLSVVWYLVSHLSAMVRTRDHELAQTNRRLIETQKEKTRHMLHTTHELKAPFSAIHANAQLLLRGHCGILPDEAMAVASRISRRCRKLAQEIQDMLQLANLRFEREDSLHWAELDLAETLDWCIHQVQATAGERTVEIVPDLHPATAIGVEDHLKMVFSNLLTNAVVYSNEGATVRVQCAAGPVVTIEDQGIGIDAGKLPHIFEEYYRTEEAAQHNKESTGLGLAIVRHVTETHGVRLRVESMPNVGTRFVLRFPAPGEGVDRGRKAKEV